MAGSESETSGGPEGPPSAEGGDRTPDGAPPVIQERRRRRDHIDWPLAATLALGLAGGLLLSGLISSLFSRLSTLLVVVVVSLFLSFAMEPAVQWLAQRGIRRGVGTMLVFLAAGLLLAGVAAAMTQLIVDQVAALIDGAPALLSNLSERAERLPGDLGESVSAWLAEQRAELPRRVPAIAEDLGRGAIVNVGSTASLRGFRFVAAEGGIGHPTGLDDGSEQVRFQPSRQKEMIALWELAISKTGGYVYSRVLTAVVSSVVHIIVFTILDLPYATALGIWVGIISSLIPVVGTYLAGALPLMIALSMSGLTAIGVLVTVVVYQQIENYLIAPRITSATMALHPAIAFLSVLAGGALLGAAGALLALPAAAVVAGLISAVGERHEVLEHGLIDQETGTLKVRR